jgi:hypothetical protein
LQPGSASLVKDEMKSSMIIGQKTENILIPYRINKGSAQKDEG